ncbi:MAG: dNTP triphosphohydrolase [Saprospiraceae bacterium]
MASWEQLISRVRTGSSGHPDQNRSAFQVDFDRLIFSSPFRRLQNKTQVFPLPGSIFVHNRLTHSLEVASVGRSLGKMAGSRLVESHGKWSPSLREFYEYDLANVISAGCLAHDIGNPAFGHLGEDAIASFFREHSNLEIDGQPLQQFVSDAQWHDLIHFEGNANSIRILTQQLQGRLPGGFRMTYTTLASIAKYPCASRGRNKKILHRKKIGFFQSEEAIFREIARETGMTLDQENPLAFRRHPFVYLVEAADDICYRVIDFEDAHRLKILRTDEIQDWLLDLLQYSPYDQLSSVKERLHSIGDINEKIAYLRAKTINYLTLACAGQYIERENELLAGELDKPLIELLPPEVIHSLEAIDAVSFSRIYKHPSVVELEIAGYHILTGLLGLFVPAVLKSNPGGLDKNILRLIPGQFKHAGDAATPYERIFWAIDYISGMTDIYATELYKKITGISIGLS